MSDFINRLVVENTELVERITKLSSFIDGEAFYRIDEVQQGLLIIQLNAMKTYHKCLVQRLIFLNK